MYYKCEQQRSILIYVLGGALLLAILYAIYKKRKDKSPSQ